MKFIHLSDLHFHGDPNENVQVTNMLTHIRVNYPAHYLIITGDITDDGDEQQYEQVYQALKPFCENQRRVFICPGNHDFGAKGNLYSLERAEKFDAMLSKPLKQGGTFAGDNMPVVNVLKENGVNVMLIALDTNLETPETFDAACGKVGETQLKALDAILSEKSGLGYTRILFFHHHPFIHLNPFMILKDAHELMGTVYERVDVVMFGHKHKSKLWDDIHGIRYVIAAGSTAEPNFVVREIEVSEGGIVVNQIPLQLS